MLEDPYDALTFVVDQAMMVTHAPLLLLVTGRRVRTRPLSVAIHVDVEVISGTITREGSKNALGQKQAFPQRPQRELTRVRASGVDGRVSSIVDRDYQSVGSLSTLKCKVAVRIYSPVAFFVPNGDGQTDQDDRATYEAADDRGSDSVPRTACIKNIHMPHPN